jgi:hypothetical protein
MTHFCILLALAIAIQANKAAPDARPFDKVRGLANPTADSLQVDLGYEIYKGVANLSTNTFKG